MTRTFFNIGHIFRRKNVTHPNTMYFKYFLFLTNNVPVTNSSLYPRIFHGLSNSVLRFNFLPIYQVCFHSFSLIHDYPISLPLHKGRSCHHFIFLPFFSSGRSKISLDIAAQSIYSTSFSFCSYSPPFVFFINRFPAYFIPHCFP